MVPKLAYWYGRGIITPIRMLLAYANVDYDYKTYTDVADWFGKAKPQLAETFDFPNLPYYIDDKVKLTQSKVILGHLGRKYGLDAANETEALRIGLIIEQASDMSRAIDGVAHVADSIKNRAEVHEILKKEYIDSIPNRLAQVDKFLGKNDWVVGNRLTYADFYLYDILDFHRLLFNPRHLNAFPTLLAYTKRVEELKGVKDFLATWDRLPITGPEDFIGQTKDYKPTD